MSDPVRYATTDDVFDLLDITSGAGGIASGYVERRVEAATREFVEATQRAYHPVRRGQAGTPESYEQHDARGINRTPPVTVPLKRSHILPIDASEEDVIEVRVGRDTWEDVTAEQGDEWTLDNRAGQLKLYRYLIRRIPFEPASERFVRLSYRFGPLTETTTVQASGVVDGVPSDVRQAVAARAAEQLILADDTQVSIPDSGQLSSRGDRADRFHAEWQDAVARHSTVQVV